MMAAEIAAAETKADRLKEEVDKWEERQVGFLLKPPLHSYWACVLGKERAAAN
eukprot:SAG22_NODE_706_length_7763_cov_4.404228_9_plen_53_part_00